MTALFTNQDFKTLDFVGRLKLACKHTKSAVFTTSLGPEDQFILALIAEHKLPIRVITLETGRLFPETRELIELSKKHFGVVIEEFHPDEKLLEKYISQFGKNGFYDSLEARHGCCGVRKLEPLARALKSADLWITGLRRSQSDNRAEIPFTEWDEGQGVQKLNPLADLTIETLDAEIAARQIPINPLHKRGYTSIGCEPCTRAIKPGEDERAGRWWWENDDSRECGLHVQEPVTDGDNAIVEAMPLLNEQSTKFPLDPHLKALENEAIHIFREAAAEFERPVMMYSIGKDSSVLLHLARKAFYPGKIPFPLLHVDTGWKFSEMIGFRDEVVEKYDLDLIVHKNQRGDAENITPFSGDISHYTDVMKTESLRQALDEGKFDVAFGGARRDEEASRAKERIYSFRKEHHIWDPRNQRPELWSIYNGMIAKGESVRAFPLSNWTEVDIWRYIQSEDIPLVPLYYAKPRPTVERDGMIMLAEDERLPLLPNEQIVERSVRFRTLGCFPLTGAIPSTATTLEEVIAELEIATISERSGRAIDKDQSASMEKKKREGYF